MYRYIIEESKIAIFILILGIFFLFGMKLYSGIGTEYSGPISSLFCFILGIEIIYVNYLRKKMIFKKIIWLIIGFNLLMANEAVLRLDTKGHSALISSMAITKDKKIITASDDKTIRVWNSNSGKEERKILGYIGQSRHKDIKVTGSMALS